MSWNIVQDEKTLHEAYNTIKTAKFLALDTETEAVGLIHDRLLGFGIGDGQNQYYIVADLIGNAHISKFLNDLYKTSEIVFQNAKFDIAVLRRADLPTPKNFHDTMIIGWLIDENSSVGLKNMAKKYLHRLPKTYKEMAEEAFMKPDNEKLAILAEYCCADVQNTIDLFFHFQDLLEAQGLTSVYYSMEFPLLRILDEMEQRGVCLDIPHLENLKERLENMLIDYKTKLIEIQGNPAFNVNSPKQVETYLFDEMGYAPVKTTRTGKRSTDSDVLEELIKINKLSEYDFVSLLLKYRDLDKLYGSFVISLLKKADAEGKIHTTFVQNGTSTGRLASQTPNLQNIPVRNDDLDVRKTFVPCRGYKFIIADYSQIELRVLAHFSQDKNMMDVFKNNEDIHAKTMQLTGTERREAKVINFGIIYGMGGFALSKLLEISKQQADNYIRKFFEGYPSVNPFINQVNAQCMSDGFITTLSGRKRHLAIEEYRNKEMLYKRLALNSLIQGSAADIIKKAMVELDSYLKSIEAHSLLQIHDELVIEVPVDAAVEAVNKIRDIMCCVYDLLVPLKVEIKIADRWEK